MSGVLQGMGRTGWDDVPLIAAEPVGAASLATSAAAGRNVTLDRIETIATSLGVKRVSDRAVRWTKEHEILHCLVEDSRAVKACRSFADDHRVLVEPASGVSLAVVYDAMPVLDRFGSVLVVVCGGIGVGLEQFARWTDAMA
jgi:L-serine/L-threonine ammonia-lyase